MLNHLKTLSNSSITWYPFTDTSLEKAKKENKTIYLLIESNSSYWSKHMNQDISTNEIIIELLNERFIAIKVQKDERPDIKKYYQRVHSLMNRQVGALPLNIFLTQDLEPFYIASYIAPHAIDSQLGFEELLRVISKKYVTDYETLCKKGREVLQYINPQEETIEATRLHLNIMQTITLHSQELLDKKFGGFTKAPKFSNTTTLELLLDVYELSKDEKLLNSVTLTLDNMSKGGYYDLKNGGFYHYAKDKKWEDAYKVKTTYDNANLATLYLRTYQLTNQEPYKTIAFKTIDFMLSQQSRSKLFSLNHEKETTSWNAMMVRTLFKAGTIDSKYTINAIETLDAILSNLYVDGMLLHINNNDKTPNIKAFLEDYSQLGETLIIAYQHTLDESFLIMATQFSNLLIEQYYNQGKWMYSSNEFQSRESIHDNGIPSSVASALSLLLSISSLVDLNYKKFVFKTLELHSYNLMRQPLSSPTLTKMMLRYLNDDIIIKSTTNLLKKHIDKRETIDYPYILFKNIEKNEFQLSNSHSTIAIENSFEELISHLESTV